MRKIDIHCHTTNRKVEDVIPTSASLDAIAAEMKKYDIEKTVVLASYFPHRGSGISNFRLHHWIKDRPEFCMFGSLDFEHYFHQGINELNELAEKELIKGIKIYTGYQNIDLHSWKFLEVVSIAKKHKLPMMFHCGYSYSSMRKYGKPTIAGLVKATDLLFVPNEHGINTIISHLAKPNLDDIITAVRCSLRVYADMSGLIDSKHHREEIPMCLEHLKRFLGECGPRKLLFGTDFPVQTHADSIYFVEEALRGRCGLFSDQHVYYNNARRLLR